MANNFYLDTYRLFSVVRSTTSLIIVFLWNHILFQPQGPLAVLKRFLLPVLTCLPPSESGGYIVLYKGGILTDRMSERQTKALTGRSDEISTVFRADMAG
jgi:hypothetical protein